MTTSPGLVRSPQAHPCGRIRVYTYPETDNEDVQVLQEAKSGRVSARQRVAATKEERKGSQGRQVPAKQDDTVVRDAAARWRAHLSTANQLPGRKRSPSPDLAAAAAQRPVTALIPVRAQTPRAASARSMSPPLARPRTLEATFATPRHQAPGRDHSPHTVTKRTTPLLGQLPPTTSSVRPQPPLLLSPSVAQSDKVRDVGLHQTRPSGLAAQLAASRDLVRHRTPVRSNVDDESSDDGGPLGTVPLPVSRPAGTGRGDHRHPSQKATGVSHAAATCPCCRQPKPGGPAVHHAGSDSSSDDGQDGPVGGSGRDSRAPQRADASAIQAAWQRVQSVTPSREADRTATPKPAHVAAGSGREGAASSKAQAVCDRLASLSSAYKQFARKFAR